MNTFTRPGPTPTVYTLGTRQTPQGAQTCVAMKLPSGANPPSQVFLQDGTFVAPDVNGQVIVPVTSIATLQNLGWLLIASSNAPSVTVP